MIQASNFLCKHPLHPAFFSTLFYVADHINMAEDCRFMSISCMDEFANLNTLPDDLTRYLAVNEIQRPRFVSIILQNMAHFFKAIFLKSRESIAGNRDEFLYLGGKEQSTHKYVSELLGKGDDRYKTTITGHTGGTEATPPGYQLSGRELL